MAWYTEIASGATDADVCFEEDGNGATRPTPKRCNLLTGECRPEGAAYGGSDGFLVAEDDCDDEGDFALDFDGRGVDGTDWGLDDDEWKCGTVATNEGEVSYPDATWHVWVRVYAPLPLPPPAPPSTPPSPLSPCLTHAGC